ncbi:22624_t:CDS:1, partial [Gigaspora rosea]
EDYKYLEEMLPNVQYKQEDYKSQINLIDNKITTTTAFFTALLRVYDYYKSEKEENILEINQKKNKQTLNKKQREYFDNKKKKKENKFKKNEFAIVPLRNMKYYNCKRKGHLISDCRSKKQNKGYTVIKERNSQKKNFQKIGTEENLTKKEIDILTKKEEHKNQEKNTKIKRIKKK